MCAKYNVYVADDHQLFRNGVALMLNTFERIGNVGQASNGRELLQMVARNPPNVVLLDLRMPVMDGERTCKRLVTQFPHVKIIVMTMDDSACQVMRMIELGAHTFLSKDTDPAEMERAIYEVIEKDYYESELMSEARQRLSKDESLRDGRLSDRELEVVILICKEYTMKQIAEVLCISEKTVQHHRTSAMRKMEVKNTAGLVRVALEQKLFP
ncbi:MAG: response regulator transcription factor [Bacteroidia bacterium]|nr:response regulator transcription factor [Bacteroidia bacterium]